jgi:hypothetical protein
MKYLLQTLILIAFFLFPAYLSAQKVDRETQLDNRVDNQGYWRHAAEQGFTKPNPMVYPAPAKYTGSGIRAVSVITDDSPDVVLVSGSTSQSENSVFVNPNNYDNALNSNNSTTQPGGGISLYGADYLYTFDASQTWGGSINGAGGSNSGDPVALINQDNRWFVGFINNASGQSIAYSDNEGATWTTRVVANSPGGFSGLLDKNHMWVDNSMDSPYEGYLYNAWTAFGGSNDNDIEIVRSTDGGDTWSSAINISQIIGAGSHSQGVNINSGPNGEVYAAFAIYDNWPNGENAYALARSFDGGATYTTARIIENTNGVRNADLGKNMRKNSFPSMAVDISTGSNRGNIYVVWANIGVPGVNSGNDVDIYMIRSEDDGVTWSEPIRVNQDPAGLGHKHYFAWITCDPVSGTLSVIFYDDRNVGGSQLEVFCANSYDGGDTWEDFKVSDVSFTPEPIPGLASGYFGDYLGINAHGGKVYPVWTDNRTGTALTYCSPYTTSTMTSPTELHATLEEETGLVTLNWTHPQGPTFSYFNIYRGLNLLGTTTFPFYSDQLPDYGEYRYMVTAYYEVEGESGPAIVDVQWGTADIATSSTEVIQSVFPDNTATATLDVSNVGQLPLTFTGTFAPIPTRETEEIQYCTATGSGCQDYIIRVELNEIVNNSGCGSYQDFTSLSTMLVPGQAYTITVLNGSSLYSNDLCGAWIDWNQDGTFGSGELISMTGSPGVGPYTSTFTVPSDAVNGTTTMRVRIVRGGTLSPCGLSPNGEVEDYSIEVLGWVNADPFEGTILAGETLPVTFSFRSTGLDLGTYAVNFVISSNDPDTPVLPVLVEMNVVDVQLTVTADNYSICHGESTILHAAVTGGSGVYTYEWSSDPPGFTSTESDPEVSPEVTTTYYVTISDGDVTVDGQVTIVVNPLPEVSLGEDQESCEGGQATFDAGAGFATYLWSNGATAQSITVSESGSYWVEVSTAEGCSSRDTVNFTVHQDPEVSLGEDFSFCEGTTANLGGDPGFSGYLWSDGSTTQEISIDQPGNYWLLVTDENGCQASDTVEVAMDALPGSTTITGGPVSVDTYESTSSSFTASDAGDAESYDWTLEPGSAGILDASGTTCTVTWTDGFTGPVQLFIKAINFCGEGPVSAAYTVQVYSSQGIPGQIIQAAKVYPNPSEGTFTLEFVSGAKQEVTLRLSNAGGSAVAEEKTTVPEGPCSRIFNLSREAKGIYYLTLEGAHGVVLFRETVVIK